MSQTRTLSVVADTTTRELDTGGGGEGCGQSKHLYVGRQGAAGSKRNYESDIKFGLDWTNVSRIVSATLNLYSDEGSLFGTSGEPGLFSVSSTDKPHVNVYRLTSAFTVGGNADTHFDSTDYTNPSRTTSGSKAASFVIGSNVLHQVDITDIVRSWAPAAVQGGGKQPNYGIKLEGTTDVAQNTSFWSSKHGNSSERPSITLVYELGPTPPNTPANLVPSGSVASLDAFESDFSDIRPTDTLQSTNIEVYDAGTVANATASTDTVNKSGHGLNNGDVIYFTSLTGGVGLQGLPTHYYVANKTSTTFQLTTSKGGAGVNITTSYSSVTYSKLVSSIQKIASESEKAAAHSIVPLNFTPHALRNYRYRVQHIDNEGQASPWSGLVTFSLTNTPPNSPVLSPASGTSVSTLNLLKFTGGTFADGDTGDYLAAHQLQLSALPPGDPGWDSEDAILWNSGKVFEPFGGVTSANTSGPPTTHVHISEREAGVWEDCTWDSGLEFYRDAFDPSKPATHTESQLLRAASGEPPTGGSNLGDFRRGVTARYSHSLPAAISAHDVLTALKPGYVAVTQGSMKAFGPTHPLSVWDRNFDGGHAAWLARTPSGVLLWCDPEAPTTAKVPVVISASDVQKFVNAFPLGQAIVAPAISWPKTVVAPKTWENFYGGRNLKAGTYYWRARQWDQKDGVSTWTYATLILTQDFSPNPGDYTNVQIDPNAPWRIIIRDMAFDAVGGALSSFASTDTFATATAHGFVANQRVHFLSLGSGIPELATGKDYYVMASGLTATGFKVSDTLGGPQTLFSTSISNGSIGAVIKRGPGATVAVFEQAKNVGASIVYNSPGELHFTLLKDDEQIAVVEPKQTHYAVEFYSGDGWQEKFAGVIWDVDATETDLVFKGIDYVALYDTIIDERYDPLKPNKDYKSNGSFYDNVTIRNIVLDQLNRAKNIKDSWVGHISIGAIATMDEKVSIYSTMQPTLSFVAGLLDSHRQGTGKRTRIKVVKTTNGTYQCQVIDDPGIIRTDLAMYYGELVQGYRLIVFGDGWANVQHVIGRDKNGSKVTYQTVSGKPFQPLTSVYGRIATVTVMDGVTDSVDLNRRGLQAAIQASKLGKNIAIGIRTEFLQPLQGWEVCDVFPMKILDGAIDTSRFGSGYWAAYACAWEATDIGQQSTIITFLPREDSSAPNSDLLVSHKVSPQPEWQIGWTPPDPLKAESRLWLDQTTGKVYERNTGTVTLVPVTGTP